MNYKDQDLKDQLFNDITSQVKKYYGSPVIAQNQEYFTLECPSCNQPSAFIYKNNPTLIKCNRANNCQYEKNYFKEFMGQYRNEKNLGIKKTDSPVSKKEDSALREYLKLRNVDKIIENTQIQISKDPSKDILFYDFQGYVIKHFYKENHSGVKYKKPKGKQEFIHLKNSEKDKNLYLVEGVYDMFTLSCIDKNVACTLGSLSQGFLENVKELLKKGEYKKLVLCYDNDEAGLNYTSKTIEHFKDMNVPYQYVNWESIKIFPHSDQVKDINDLFRTYSKQELKNIDLFTSSLDILKKEAIGEFYQLTGKQSFDLYNKTPRLWFKEYGINLYNGLNVIGARTSNFKTSFMLNLFNSSLNKNNITQFSDEIESDQNIKLKPLFITLEEDIGNTIKKLDYINFQTIYTKEDKDEKEKAYIKIYETLLDKESPLIALDYSDWSKISGLISVLIRLGYNLFFIDYLQLIQNTHIDNRYQAIGEITSTLNMLGNKHGVYFILGSQLTERNFNNALPSLDMLRESSNIANDAKNIYLLEYLYKEDTVLICNPKNRYALKSTFNDHKDDKDKVKHNKHYIVDKFKILEYRDPFNSHL